MFSARNFFASKSNPPVQQPLEMVGLCTRESSELVGAATRAEVRERNLPHRLSFCLVLDSAESHVLVQKRVAWKETYPSYFDPCPGGVMGPDESFEKNAIRELEEEMGIIVGSALSPEPVKPLFDFWFENDISRAWGRLFKVNFKGTIDDLKLQPEEVESVQWLDHEELARLLRIGPVCPDSAVATKRWLDEYVQLNKSHH